MNSLPNEIICNIFKHLKTDHIMLLSVVNKRLNNITKQFLKKEIMFKTKKKEMSFPEIYKLLKLSSIFYLYKTSHFIDQYKIKIKDKEFCEIFYTNDLFFVHYYSLEKGYNYKDRKSFYMDFLIKIRYYIIHMCID